MLRHFMVTLEQRAVCFVVTIPPDSKIDWLNVTVRKMPESTSPVLPAGDRVFSGHGSHEVKLAYDPAGVPSHAQHISFADTPASFA